VRHPIYTGIVLAAFASAAIGATPTALLGALLIVAFFVAKARLEEQLLLETLGDSYQAYRCRVPMFVPFFSAASS
jgi:protein-S-isoprenylcysteine O-methyltransferase Ste14